MYYSIGICNVFINLYKTNVFAKRPFSSLSDKLFRGSTLSFIYATTDKNTRALRTLPFIYELAYAREIVVSNVGNVSASYFRF